MSKSIRISPKHGANPALPVCFWCGQETGELALLGYLKNDAQAPQHIVLDYEPCDQCKALWDQGVVLIEVSETPLTPKRPPIQDNLYPTGRSCILKEDAVSRIFTPEAAEAMLAKKKAFLSKDAYERIVKNA